MEEEARASELNEGVVDSFCSCTQSKFYGDSRQFFSAVENFDLKGLIMRRIQICLGKNEGDLGEEEDAFATPLPFFFFPFNFKFYNFFYLFNL